MWLSLTILAFFSLKSPCRTFCQYSFKKYCLTITINWQKSLVWQIIIYIYFFTKNSYTFLAPSYLKLLQEAKSYKINTKLKSQMIWLPIFKCVFVWFNNIVAATKLNVAISYLVFRVCPDYSLSQYLHEWSPQLISTGGHHTQAHTHAHRVADSCGRCMCGYYFMAHGNYRCRYNKLSLNLLFVVLIVVRCWLLLLSLALLMCCCCQCRCSCHRRSLVTGSLGQDSASV